MKRFQNLISIMREARAFLAIEGNDFSWSSWRDPNHAISEIDSIITELENDSVRDIRILFAPTGPIQEVSLSSGWGNEFLKLAERFDKEFEIINNRS